MTYAVVRVRGRVNVRGEVRDTLRFLRLHRANHCVLVPKNSTVDGMLRRARDYVTWGEVEPSVAGRLLAGRAQLTEGKPLDDAYVKEHTSFPTVDALTKAIATGRTTVSDVPGLKPVFRLHPPLGGYEGTKHGFAEGGALGYRGKDINALILRMVEAEDA